MATKKRQYHMWQYNQDDLYEKDGKLMLDISIDDAVTTSETLMYYILNEKILKKEYDTLEEFKTDEDGNSKKVKKNKLPIITIETGRSRSDKDNEKLEKLLKEGFYLNTEPEVHMVFLDNVLSGSQNKECRQIFIQEKPYENLKEHISLGIEPSKCTISKNLTRNALTTTDVHLVPVDMKSLGICIIPDCEVPVYETVNMIKPYNRTAEEDKKYDELMAWIEEDKEYYKAVKAGSDVVNAKDCTIEKQTKKNRKKATYKTVRQWNEKGRKVKLEELENPKARFYVDDKEKYYALYIEEQTNEIVEEEIKEIPITEWSTELQLVTEENHKCMENVFDGMGLVSKRLGSKFEKHLEVKHKITGYQLRLPCVKGFFPCVDFHGYYKKHGVGAITDMWGKSHAVEDIDLLITESTFKAKLNVTGVKEDGSEKKAWLFDSVDDYKNRLMKYGYDVIGISNFAKPIEEQYRRATYQLWLALNVGQYDMMAFANVQGDIIHKVLTIYRKEELDWEDIKYIESFLNLIQQENPDTNLEKECADAIKAIHINKKMVFDRKVIKTIKDVIIKKINDMCLGRMYIKGKYMYVTQDILAFLRFAGAEDKENWQYKGFLNEKECYSGGNILGRTVLARNPIVSYSEITKVDFVDYNVEDVEFVKHIHNIVQMPLGTEPDRLGGCDKDGDEVLVLPTDYNLKDTQIEFLQNYNFISKTEEKAYYKRNMLEFINERMQDHFNKKFTDKEIVTLEDFIVPSYVQVNDDDKATAMSKEWNKENVIDFILSSEDKTGQITDIDSSIENVGIAEGDLTKYALPIAIMKDMQGKMIDASKSGLFDEVVIPEVIKLKYNKRPQFMYYKDGNEFNKDYDTVSGLDFLAKQMEKFKNYVDRVMVENVNRKIKKQNFNNIYRYMQNFELDGTVVQDIIEKLEPVYDKFIYENRTLAILKSHINRYSSDVKYKREREIVDQKFKNLYERTRMAAEEISDCPSLLATASVRMTYINSKYNNRNDNYSFCWIIASEGILQNIKMNEDREKIYITRADVNDDHVFEWLGDYFKVVTAEEETVIEFDEEKNMSIPEEYLRKDEVKLEDISGLKVTIMGAEKGRTEEIAENMLNSSFELFETDKGWLGLWRDMSIKERETLDAGIDLRAYLGHQIVVKEIVQAKNNQSIIKAIIDIKG
jgi:ribosomal protein S15P/S13E